MPSDSILILGSNSYLARQTFSELLKSDRRVSTVSRQPQPESDFHTVGDCFDEAFLADVVSRVNPATIISFIGGPTCPGNYADLVTLNCGVLQQLCRVALEGVKVISIGSAAEYGAATEEFLTEYQEVKPASDYGHAKLAQSAFATGMTPLTGAHLIIVRLFNLIGSNTPSTLISEKIRQRVVDLETSEDLILDDPDMTRDFIDVADVASGLVALVESDCKAGIYNLCSGRATSLAELAAAFMTSHEKKGFLKKAEKPEFRSPVRRAVGSTNKFLAATKWSASRTLQQSANDQAAVTDPLL